MISILKPRACHNFTNWRSPSPHLSSPTVIYCCDKKNLASSSSMNAIFLLCLAFSSRFITVDAAIRSCYYPDGTLSPDPPCNTTTTGHSACCTALCMSSGLCFDNGLMSRGGCTDPTWKDSACPQYCTDCKLSLSRFTRRSDGKQLSRTKLIRIAALP
jgi:hypothetical protein